jgi:DNA-directed RNA polymerase specialized sigma24 family protein
MRGVAMAKTRVVVTEEDLEQLLREDPKFAVEMIDSDYRENIWRYIRSRCRYFDDDDVHEVYVNTLKDFIRCVKKPEFDPKAPLKLIFHIAKLRARDRRRVKKASAEPTFDALLDVIVEDMKDTTTRLNWQLMKSDWPEFRATLEKLIDQLPDKQRDAMKASSLGRAFSAKASTPASSITAHIKRSAYSTRNRADGGPRGGCGLALRTSWATSIFRPSAIGCLRASDTIRNPTFDQGTLPSLKPTNLPLTS